MDPFPPPAPARGLTAALKHNESERDWEFGGGRRFSQNGRVLFCRRSPKLVREERGGEVVTEGEGRKGTTILPACRPAGAA